MKKNINKISGNKKRGIALNWLMAGILMLSLLTQIKAAGAQNFYNFGTLDVKPVYQDGAENKSWFVEYLKRGEQKQEMLRISNFSSATKELTIYSADNSSDLGKDFVVKSPDQKSDDISEWISLPTKTLTLKSGESKIISVNFKLPKNAGVGIHTGAILVRENHQAGATDTPLSIEKGVRVYLNVTGPSVTASSLNQVNLKDSGNQLELQVSNQNLGTTDFKPEYTATLQKLDGSVYSEETTKNLIKPQQSATTVVTLQKPTFGIYQLYLSSNGQSSYINTQIFIPFWAVALILVAAFFASLSVAQKKQNLNWGQILTSFKNGFQNLQLQKSAIYFGMLVMIVAGINYLNPLSPDQLKTDVLNNDDPISNYQMTIKWGTSPNAILPSTFKKKWGGEFVFTDARVSLDSFLNFEDGDSAQTGTDNTVLKFALQTGPDNDGIVLKVTPTGENIPQVIYKNYATNEEIPFSISDFINDTGSYPDGPYMTSIKTDAVKLIAAPELANEQDASAETNASKETETTPIINNLFTEELPATPEVLADFILNSDYVDAITNGQNTNKVETDPVLIKALEASKEILHEITASSELNFLFIPNEVISFPPQEFSFNRNKISAQNLGTLIFVQNQDAPWNTYVKTTDFVSLSGKGTISASALTITPGKAEVLIQDGVGKIEVGKEKKFQNSNDENILVNVKADNQTQAFVLNPVLEIKIPPNTLPGKYQGTLTITSL